MEKMTLGCYLGFIKRSCFSLVNNKEPPAGIIAPAVLTQHDYDSTGGDGWKNDGTRNSHSKCRLHNTIMAKP